MNDNAHRPGRNQLAPRISVTSAHQSPGKLLHDAHMRLSTGFVGALSQAGHALPIDAWAVLNLLWEEDNLPQFEIGARISRDRHQTSRLIDSLTKQGFVTRESSPEDRRVKYVVLTESGRAAQVTLRNIATEYLETIFTGVTQQDYDGFIRCLRHIVNRLTPTNEPGEDL